MKLNKVR